MKPARSLRVFAILCGLVLSWPAQPALQRIVLLNGDQVTGTVIQKTESHVVLEHEALGRVSISLEQVAIFEAIEVSPESIDVSDSSPDAAIEPLVAPPVDELGTAPRGVGLFGSDVLIGWQRRLSAGITGSTGNSERLDGSLAARLAREDEDNRVDLNSAWFFARAGGETRSHEAFLQGTRDWLEHDSRWFLFARGRYDFDDFEPWEHRLSAFGGPGYQLVDTDAVNLRARLGLGASRTFGIENRLLPEAEGGLEGAWRLTERQTLEGSVSIFPDLSQVNEFRVLASTSWTMKLSPLGDLSLQLGVEDTYQSDPEGGARPNDLNYYGRVGYEF